MFMKQTKHPGKQCFFFGENQTILNLIPFYRKNYLNTDWYRTTEFSFTEPLSPLTYAGKAKKNRWCSSIKIARRGKNGRIKVLLNLLLINAYKINSKLRAGPSA